MTDTQVDLETQANRIAARGREALAERMRSAYGDAAAAHADLISLDEDHIETMVQAAVDTADGLQWRRALARVASDELGLSVSEALSHPAVTRAQQLVGAPSYEQSLAELIARPVPPPIRSATADGSELAIAQPSSIVSEAETQAEPEADLVAPPEADPEAESEADAEAESEAEEQVTSDELESVEADDVVLELLPEPEPIEYETEAYDVEASFAQEPVPAAPVNPFATQTPHEAAAAQDEETATGSHQPESEAAAPAHETELMVPAVHLGGVANLPTKREGLSVRLSEDGLDIMQGPGDIIGRLVWDEIETLEVPHLRARRRGKQVRARLIVRTPHGDASFEVPEISADELRDRVEPLMRLYIRQ